ncbi:hypothetical protein ACN3XK_72845, partial [Actinomadura welshii]
VLRGGMRSSNLDSLPAIGWISAALLVFACTLDWPAGAPGEWSTGGELLVGDFMQGSAGGT